MKTASADEDHVEQNVGSKEFIKSKKGVKNLHNFFN